MAVAQMSKQDAGFSIGRALVLVTLVAIAAAGYWCTRTPSFLSGRYPYEHDIRDNTGYRVPQTMPAAATRLKTRGFATGACDHAGGNAVAQAKRQTMVARQRIRQFGDRHAIHAGPLAASAPR